MPGTAQSLADHENGFADGKYALNWTGNWLALSVAREVRRRPPVPAGARLRQRPQDRRGLLAVRGLGARASIQDGANAFIEFALQDKYFTAFSDGIGLIPPTRSAAAASKY